jgi:two-component system sensor histidine kinase CreC
MYVAAPIVADGQILGVVSLAKPIDSLETHLVAESKQLQRYAFLLLLLALAIGYLLSLWFTWALGQIRDYANAMAKGRDAQQPAFMDSRLSDLSDAVTNLRKQLDGKEYVENYIHSLTHELKTPLTSIGATVELLREPMSEHDRDRFFDNLVNSNTRLTQLVDRMLSLAQLEAASELVNAEHFDLAVDVKQLTQERRTLANEQTVTFSVHGEASFEVFGDRVLLSQAIGNLLDNALRFCSNGSEIEITLSKDRHNYQVTISNRGEQIPEYALDKIYDRFFSLPSSTNGESGTRSTGLGLSFVKEIMKLHNGGVTVDNHQQGVTATLRWSVTRT